MSTVEPVIVMFLVHPLVSIERLSDSRSNCDTVRIGSVIGTPGALEGRHVHKHKLRQIYSTLDLATELPLINVVRSLASRVEGESNMSFRSKP